MKRVMILLFGGAVLSGVAAYAAMAAQSGVRQPTDTSAARD
jgi:hypothetical protein